MKHPYVPPTPCVIRTVTRRQSKNAAAHDKIVQQVQEQEQATPKDPDVITPLPVVTEVCDPLPDLQGNSVQTVEEVECASSITTGGNSWGAGGGCGPPNFWPTTLFSGFSHTTDRKVPSEVVLMGAFST